jgi:hypothetical protein
MPTILLVATNRWFASARIAMTLARSGCRVTTCALEGHPFEKTGVVSQNFPFAGLNPVQSVLAALKADSADCVVACDEGATSILHRVYELGDAEGGSPALRELLAKSLGNPRFFAAALSRTRLMDRAAKLGIRIPAGQNVDSPGALEAWARKNEFPAYLKADGTSGGVGVKRIENMQQARAAYRKLHAPPSFARTLKRLVVNRDPMLVLPFFMRKHPEISVQSAVAGVEATCAISCWQGEVLSTLSMEVLQRTEPQGPASVLRQLDNPEMTRAAELLVNSLGLSGLVGLDFMIETATGDAYLLELNLRATQTAHLCMGPKQAPAFALGAKLQGIEVLALPVETRREVALFPQEWIRDPQSRYLSGSFHDIPLQAPELVREALRKRSDQFRNVSAEECVQVLQRHSVSAPVSSTAAQGASASSSAA